MYGLDLSDALWGEKPMSVRKLVALMRHLPEDNAVTRAVGYWDQKSELLATIVDQIGLSNHLYVAAHVKEGTKIGDPVGFPRPWDDKPRLKVKEETTEDTTAPEGSSYDDVRGFFMQSWTEDGGANMAFGGWGDSDPEGRQEDREEPEVE